MTTFTLEGLRELTQHMEWADALIWRTALAHPPATRDSRLRDLLLHLHFVQRAFLEIWSDRPVHFPQRDDFPDIAAVRAWTHPYYAELATFLATLDEASLTRTIQMPWVSQFEQRTGRQFHQPSLAETMFQVTSHSTYHRGQVNLRLREVGAEPPLVDYIAWVWFGKPAAEWLRSEV